MLSNQTKQILFILFFFLFINSTLKGQSTPLSLELRFGINCNLNNFFLFKKNKQKFPGFRLFGTAIFSGEINSHFSVNYGTTLLLYNKSLGNNLNPLVSDIQIDFINSLCIGAGYKLFEKKDNHRIAYTKYLRTINSGPFYNLKHNYTNAVFIGTNFIINNHHRNQTNGTINLTFGDFSVSYYNDAEFPFTTFSLSDGFDRFWTGGFVFYLHNNHEYNMAEFSFDQFTGYSPLLYELSNILGANVPEYKTEKSSASNSSAYNSSAYNLKLKFNKNYGFDLGIIGSLTSRNGRHWGIQDLIHIERGNSLHPNQDINRIYIGMTYEQFGYSF